jgi:hypothetical protein
LHLQQIEKKAEVFHSGFQTVKKVFKYNSWARRAMLYPKKQRFSGAPIRAVHPCGFAQFRVHEEQVKPVNWRKTVGFSDKLKAEDSTPASFHCF